ncbi:MAG: hypothetical protein IKY23_04140 [Lachnospiraceae bacterium]|nr:hypothetical protein [Lachnospiraceae bacterium]
MSTLHPLTHWVIQKIEAEYKDDIALLIGIKGHSTDDDMHGECFDYFIPATERGYELSQTFIIDGVGHDLYGRSWERVELSAELKEMAIVLSGATILYARSPEDAARFEDMQKRLQDNLANDAFVYEKALEQLDKALEVYQSFIFEEKSYRARSEAQVIHLYLSSAVALMNHTYTDSPIFTERQAYDNTPESNIYHCPEMTQVPDGFFTYASRLLITQDVNELRQIVYQLISTTRAFVLERKPETITGPKELDYQELADWYQELSLTWRRIRYFCQNKMVEKAYTDSCYLQNELLYIAEEFDLEEMNLLDSFNADDLELLALRSDALEQKIRHILKGKGIVLNEYASLEDFLNTST